MSKISKNIKKLRGLNGMTQEELANKIHVTRQTVSSWETDRTQPDLEILLSLAEIFGVQVEELIYGKRKNTAEEKEKLLFGNTLVTVLSILGCLLIGAGAVMIFIKFWKSFPDALKIFTCFVPALLGQGFGIYTYIKKRESQAWCEGASVLWMLGTAVTVNVLLSQVSSVYRNGGLESFFMAVCFFVVMLVFRSLAPLAVVHSYGIMWCINVISYLNLYFFRENGTADARIKFLLTVAAGAAFTAAVIYASSRLFKKESNIIRYRFAQWINFAATAVFTVYIVILAGFGEGEISLAVLAAIICFLVGEKHESFVSPYKLLGTLACAGALCFFAILSSSDGYKRYGVAVTVTAMGLVPLIFMLHEKMRPKNRYLLTFVILVTVSLFAFNMAGLFDTVRSITDYSGAYNDLLRSAEKVVLNLNFAVCISALVMLIVYGAKERKLLYLNLGFILSCVSVIVKLYLLDLGLVVTGLLLMACGAGLLFVNLKIVRIREKEKLASLKEGEGEEQ